MDGALRTILDRFTVLVNYLLLAVRALGYFISNGSVSGSSGLYLFGRASSNPASTLIAVWPLNIAYPWATVDQTITVRSTSGNDASPAGTGALTVRVWWLDAAGVERTTDYALNGINPVTDAGATTARRVNRAQVLTVGVGGAGANDGDITVYWTDNATVFARILAGRGINDGVVQTVPAGKKDVLWWWSGDVDRVIKYPIYTLNRRSSGIAPWLIADRFCMVFGAPSDNLRYSVPLILPAGTDYYVGVWESGGGLPLAASLLGWRENA